jgi:hypothetical protein
VAPPSFLFDKIKNSIEEENVVFGNKLKSLFNHSVTPPAAAISFGAIMNKIKETDQLNQLKPLRDYEVAAPFSFAKLMEIIRSKMASVTIPAATNAKVIPMGIIKRIAAAAAVLALCFIGYNVYQKNTVSSQGNSVASSTKNNNNIDPVANNNSTIPLIDTINNANTLLPKNSSQIASIVGSRKNNIVYSSNPKSFRSRSESKNNIVFGMGKEPITASELNIGGSNIPFIDNDYLATFASLNETNLPPFLQAEKPVATVITIDDYTDITISENMGATMKKMYKTKKSGKPTRRARKTKEKLEKWKIADSTFFSPNSTMNPLDPFDLGNFILIK